MSEKRQTFVFIILNLIILNGVTLAVMNLRYPLIGHDYTLALPSFLDTALHYRLNGLSIQWFTSTFGGGIPVFPNPNSMQFSLPAFLTVILPPWASMMSSAIFYVTAGFIACFYFLRNILKLNWTASMLGSFFFSANGFVITRMATGQLGYFAFTLLALFLIVLLDPKLPTAISASLMGLLLAMYVHAAGYFIIIIFGLSILMVLPMLYLYKAELFDWKRILFTVAVGGVLGLVISLSKLAATFSFMGFFPRLIADNSTAPFFIGMVGILLQLLGTQNLVPLFLLRGMNPGNYPNFIRGATGTSYGMWELDISMTPVVFIIVLMIIIQFVHAPKNYTRFLANRREKIAFMLLLLFTWLAIEFTVGKGLIYPILKQLPILSSLRGNVRFAAAFIFPLAFFSAVAYNKWTQNYDPARLLKTFILVNLLAIVPLSSYFLFKEDMLWMFYDLKVPQQIYEEMQANKSFEITNVGKPEGFNSGALLYRTSNLNLYEPVFGFELENFHPQVQAGSVWTITNDHYNLTDPTSLVYPELNHNRPFDRFRVQDKAVMELFVKHIQPDWNIPLYQRALNRLSLTAFLATLIHLAFQIRLSKTRKVLP